MWLRKGWVCEPLPKDFLSSKSPTMSGSSWGFPSTTRCIGTPQQTRAEADCEFRIANFEFGPVLRLINSKFAIRNFSGLLLRWRFLRLAGRFSRFPRSGRGLLGDYQTNDLFVGRLRNDVLARE